jgi:excisionase family DNA binding protein
MQEQGSYIVHACGWTSPGDGDNSTHKGTSASSSEHTEARHGAARQVAELQPLLIDAADVATLTGLALRTIRRLDAAGRIPDKVRIGRMVKFQAEEVRRWIAAGCPTTLPQSRRGK